MPERTLREALREGLRAALARDPRVLLLGEDLGAYGGAFGVTRGLLEEFGPRRVIETPISENSVVGVAAGLAVLGWRPVVEIMFADFLALACDQLLNHATKLHYIYGGQVRVPLVVRAPTGPGRGYGPSHSQSLEGLFQGLPGLRIVAPAGPAEAAGLLAAALAEDNPVLFLEHKLLYDRRAPVAEPAAPLPLGRARTVEEGRDLALFSFARGLEFAREAAAILRREGRAPRVVDLVSLKPLDAEALVGAVRETHRALIVEEGPLTGGVGAEAAALLAAEALGSLEAPVLRVAAADAPVPASPEMERLVVPGVEEVLAAARKIYSW